MSGQMNQFTKGPWKYEYDNADHYGGCWYSITDEDGGNVCAFGYNVADSVANEKLANAKLIAAAPDLYEALQAMLEFPNAGPSHDMARAALSKATA